LCCFIRDVWHSGPRDGQAFYALVLGATLVCAEASANHMLIIFLGVEMASVPVLRPRRHAKGRRQSSEAALKYAVYGAGAAGIMLYGSVCYPACWARPHADHGAQLALMISSNDLGDRSLILTLGGLMIGVVWVKLSAVPFHFWCPDVFEGAAPEVNAFLRLL